MVVNSLMATKLVGMTILGSVSIVCGMLPIFISKKMGWTNRTSGSGADSLSPFTRSLLSGILCFGGGILMGTGFLHMLPEVYEGWETYAQTNHIDINLALGIVVICAGFFLVYFVEEVAHLVVDRIAHNRTEVSLHRAVSIRACQVGSEPTAGGSGDTESGVVGEVCQMNSICKQSNCETEKEFCRDAGATGENKRCSPVDHDKNDIVLTDSITNLPSPTDRYGTFDRSIPATAENNSNIPSHIDNPNNSSSSERKEPSSRHSHHHHGMDGSLNLQGLLIIVALSLHEILEGTAIGLQNDMAGVIQLCTAVAAHKFVISFCVGLELSTSGVKFLVHTIYIFIFSLVTPIGAGIGLAMTSHLNEGDPDQSLASLIMQGLACGTILYVAFFEILERERAKEWSA